MSVPEEDCRGAFPCLAFQVGPRPKRTVLCFYHFGCLYCTMSSSTTPLFNTTEPDFAGLDPEQVRLMGEQLIVLDKDDKPVGTASKSVCEGLLFCTKEGWNWSHLLR